MTSDTQELEFLPYPECPECGSEMILVRTRGTGSRNAYQLLTHMKEGQPWLELTPLEPAPGESEDFSFDTFEMECVNPECDVSLRPETVITGWGNVRSALLDRGRSSAAND